MPPAAAGGTGCLAHALTDIDLAAVPVKGPGLRVRDVMTSNPLILDEDLPLRTAALLLFHYDVAGTPVQDAHGNLLGVLSEADLLEKEASPHTGLDAFLTREATRRDRLRSARTVGEACTRPAWVTDASSTLQDAACELLDHRIARLVVLDHSRIAGVVSRHDVLAALIRAGEHIQADVDRVLVTVEEPAVRAVVEWGRVTVTGTVERCSRLSELRARLEQVDGVMDLDLEQLTWRIDDVSVVTPMF